MNNQQEEHETIKCPICDRPGKVQAVEGVPGDGILYECIHEDGKVCEWARFEGGLGSFKNIKADRMISPEIECPQCGSKGVIKTERNDNNRPDRYSYRISHPNGSRCFIRKENRAVVLKALGRYIEPSTTTAPAPATDAITALPKRKREYHRRPQIRCPKCNEMGSASNYDHLNIMAVIHHFGGVKKPLWHHMSTPKLRKQFLALVPVTEERDRFKKKMAEIVKMCQVVETAVAEIRKVAEAEIS